MELSKRYRRFLSFILIFLNVSILFYERSTRSLSVSLRRKLPFLLSKKKNSPYYNRYCHRQQPRISEYGYVSVIRQILWLKNASENVSENDGPLIFYDSRGSSHSLSFDGCQHRCRFSTAFSDYQQAAIAVFTEEPPAKALPKPDNQLWALESGESPFNMPFAGLTRDYVDLILTTNPESHVPYAYGVFMANQKPEYIIPVQDQIRMLDINNIRWLPKHHAQRKRKVVALISNWSPNNNRTNYVNELANFTDVDIYGSGRMGCIRDAEYTCLQNLSLQYKFYLAFENSNCAGHVTEKFFINGLSFGMLPVVMGASREVYCAVAPPNSFIHVDDFSSPAELADYLNWLDKNDDAYASYFAWQAYGKVLTETIIECRLCAFVYQNLNNLPSIPKEDFDYFTNVSRQCQVF